ncbi:MAG TPA: hypothetical protein PLQ81_10405, partial [bacterium]|nr:hypothetical protein [bacterium]
IFDYTGHLFHFSDKLTEKFFQDIQKKNINKLQRKAFIKILDGFIPYPFQLNLSYLPEDKRFDCLNSILKKYNQNKVSRANYLKWMLSYYGNGICDNFMIPYNEKLWKTNLSKITTDWFSDYMPAPAIESILNGALKKQNNYKGYNYNFYYPKKNGIGSLINGVYNIIKDKVVLNSTITGIDFKNKIISASTEKYKYENLITTIPLPDFLKLCVNRGKFESLISKLDYVSIFNINYGIDSSVENKRHWIYFPEKKYDFYRAGFYHNFSRYSVPSPELHSSYVEISSKSGLDKFKTASYLNQIKKQFFDIGIYSRKDSKICQQFLLDIKYGYVIFDKRRKKIMEILRNFYENNSIYPVGRYAEWNYSSMQNSIKSAFTTVSGL